MFPKRTDYKKRIRTETGLNRHLFDTGLIVSTLINLRELPALFEIQSSFPRHRFEYPQTILLCTPILLDAHTILHYFDETTFV